MYTKNERILKNGVIFFLSLFVISIPIVWVSLAYTNYHGDLTRIAKQSEFDFGWTTEQPKINPKDLHGSPIEFADVLVIGDSFSVGLVWQSQLLQNGHKVATYHWNENHLICKDFGQTLNNSNFKGKTLIFEIVELGAEKRIKDSVECPHHTSKLKSPIISAPSPDQQLDLSHSVNLTGQFFAGAETIFNSTLINFSANYPDTHNKKNKSGKIYHLPNGCEFFSNKLCQFGLFYHQDYRQPPLSIKTIENIQVINKQLNNYNVIWLIIPNKSSVYHRNIPLDFWAGLTRNRLGPNLLNDFRNKKYHTKDLYKPNDTHLSTSGYLYLGQIVNQHIKR